MIDEFSWAVGFFEGEGYIGHNGNRNGIRLTVTNTDLSLLDRFQAFADFGGIYPIQSTNLTRRACYAWASTSTPNCLGLLSQMFRYLSERRRTQAITVCFRYVERSARIHPRYRLSEEAQADLDSILGCGVVL